MSKRGGDGFSGASFEGTRLKEQLGFPRGHDSQHFIRHHHRQFRNARVVIDYAFVLDSCIYRSCEICQPSRRGNERRRLSLAQCLRIVLRKWSNNRVWALRDLLREVGGMPLSVRAVTRVIAHPSASSKDDPS